MKKKVVTLVSVTRFVSYIVITRETIKFLETMERQNLLKMRKSCEGVYIPYLLPNEKYIISAAAFTVGSEGTCNTYFFFFFENTFCFF